MNNIFPLVSIVVPTFNSEKHLVETIDSVIVQTYSNWELIMVDDGSKDSTSQVAKTYVIKYDNIYFLQRDRLPKGGNACRNIGLYSAKGKYVIFLDSDDLLAPWCLEKRVEYMNENQQLDFAVFKMARFVDNISTVIAGKSKQTDKPLEHFIAMDCIWQITSPIWKREFMLNIGGFNEEYQRLQDVELSFRALTFQTVQFSLSMNDTVDCYYRQEVKILNKEFWSKGFIQVQKYLLQVNDWIENNANNRKQYRKSLNRSAWNYVLYFWKAYEVTNNNVRDFMKFMHKSKIVSNPEYLIMECIISCNIKIIRNSKLFHKIVESFIRLMKSQFSKNFLN